MFFKKKPFLKNSGYCVCCDRNTVFVSENNWLRDFYVCMNCGSIPRERALMYAIERYAPNWKNLVIHESSPAQRGASLKLQNLCKSYIPTQYFPSAESGSMHNGIQCENLEKLSFPDESIDLHVTQDVFEHLFSPEKAFSEIHRTLKPKGMLISTVPLENKQNPTQIVAELTPAGIKYHFEPVYHGNPVSESGSLVTRKWGYDIVDFIYSSSGMTTTIMYIDNIEYGIRAEFIEVLISCKF